MKNVIRGEFLCLSDAGEWWVLAGSLFREVVKEAAVFAAQKKGLVAFSFSGVQVAVAENSDPDLMERDLRRAMAGVIIGSVGPYPLPNLTAEEKHTFWLATARKRAFSADVAMRASKEAS